MTSSSCSRDFFKWRLFIRLPPPARDCVKLHGLICASMIRARREICAPPRFPRRFTISRLPFSSFACCHCLVPCSGCVLLLLALPVDSFMCSARTDLLAKQEQQTHKTQRKPPKNTSSERLTVLLQTVKTLQQESEARRRLPKVLHLVTGTASSGTASL